MAPRTKQNLNTAMLNEALAYAKYSRFAACARINESPELATLFQRTADVDRIEHFRREFEMAMTCMDDSTNLKTAMHDKARQIDMYNEFAAQAHADGDATAARLFERVARDQLLELASFQEALETMQNETTREEVAV